MTHQSINKGWLVTFSGTGINLALGILYTWSIFKGAIKESIDQGGQGAFLAFTLEGKRVREESPFSKKDAALTYEESH